jgi:hypothetical protein
VPLDRLIGWHGQEILADRSVEKLVPCAGRGVHRRIRHVTVVPRSPQYDITKTFVHGEASQPQAARSGEGSLNGASFMRSFFEWRKVFPQILRRISMEIAH